MVLIAHGADFKAFIGIEVLQVGIGRRKTEGAVLQHAS